MGRGSQEIGEISGLGFEEICNTLDVSPSNVRVLRHRARTKQFSLVDHFRETGECRSAEGFNRGPVPWRECMALRPHLPICPHCRRYVRQLRQLRQSLRRPAEPAAPETLERSMKGVEGNGSTV